MPVISMRPNRLATLALSGAALILLCLWAWGAGYRCNPTPSLPVGLYRLAAGTPSLWRSVCPGRLPIWRRNVATSNLVPVLPGCGLCSNAWPGCPVI